MSVLRRLWALRRERPLLVALSVLTLAVLLVWPVVDHFLRAGGVVTPFGFNDYGAYSGAVERWQNGERIYVPDGRGGYHASYLYPPVTLLLFYPFATLDFVSAAVLLGVLSIVLLWLGLDAVAGSLGYDLGVGDRLLFLFALFGFQPALRAFKWAQIPTLLAAALCFAFYAAERGAGDGGRAARYASGALTTLGSAFKLFFAPSGAHLLRDRDRFAGAMATAALLVIASLAVFGVEVHRTYLDVLLWGKGWGANPPAQFWDTSAAYRPLAVLGPLATPVRAAGVLGVVALSLAARGVETAAVRRATFALGVAAIPVLAPRADNHDLVVLLLPALVLLALELEGPDGRPWLPVLAVLLVHFHQLTLHVAVNPPGWLPLAGFVSGHAAWFQPGVWGTFLLVGLAARHVARPISSTWHR